MGEFHHDFPNYRLGGFLLHIFFIYSPCCLTLEDVSTAGLEKDVFFPDAASFASGNAAKDIVVVFFERSIITNDASINERGELAVKNLSVANLAAFLVRIGHTSTSSEVIKLIHRTTVEEKQLVPFPKNFHTPSSSKSLHLAGTTSLS